MKESRTSYEFTVLLGGPREGDDVYNAWVTIDDNDVVKAVEAAVDEGNAAWNIDSPDWEPLAVYTGHRFNLI